MKYGAGFLTAACAWVATVMMQSLDAGHAPQKHAAADDPACRPKELTALTKSLVEVSLKGFDEANGEDIGTWSPGFPELQVHQNSPLNASKVQCCLLFMSQGLEKVLVDQKNNLNPTDVSLHEKLRNAISKVDMLAACVKSIHEGECSPKPPPPKMPKHAFERKQWSHTLLKTARDYLSWLESKFVVRISKVEGKNKTLAENLEGSGYLL